jgi:hypothetical protein
MASVIGLVPTITTGRALRTSRVTRFVASTYEVKFIQPGWVQTGRGSCRSANRPHRDPRNAMATRQKRSQSERRERRTSHPLGERRQPDGRPTPSCDRPGGAFEGGHPTAYRVPCYGH